MPHIHFHATHGTEETQFFKEPALRFFGGEKGDLLLASAPVLSEKEGNVIGMGCPGNVSLDTSSTAQGGGGSSNNREAIGEIGFVGRQWQSKSTDGSNCPTV